ncbi:MAG: GNAT family N-acetyltransferase [Anaerolineales bacterium]|nr:GNAT family N-acetyltransferase [Anaerolineales bacterium]
MSAPEIIRLLEEISLDAWPAFETSLYDGWVIRFADGFSRRSNSTVPLYPSRLDVMEKIRRCEAMYRERGQRTVFKLTAESEPRELGLILSGDGYRPEAETGMWTMPLRNAGSAPAPDVQLQDELTEEWISALCAYNAYDPRHHETVRALTRLIRPPRVFASIRRDGKIIGCGLGVIRHGYLAIFDIVVEAGSRRRGFGKQIMADILDWGRRQSAETAFLQVMADNPAAMAMYDGLGFCEQYRYVYWVKD